MIRTSTPRCSIREPNGDESEDLDEDSLRRSMDEESLRKSV